MYSYLSHQSELYIDVLTLSAVGSLHGCSISINTQIRALVQVIMIYVCSLSDLFPAGVSYGYVFISKVLCNTTSTHTECLKTVFNDPS